MLNAVNDFLDESFVLPDIGNYTDRKLLNLQNIQEIRERKREKRGKAVNKLDNEKADNEYFGTNGDAEKPGGEGKKKEYDPLVITRTPFFLFGGVINEWKKRFPLYLSDFKDGLDSQVIATASFIFFACLSGAIGKKHAFSKYDQVTLNTGCLKNS